MFILLPGKNWWSSYPSELEHLRTIRHVCFGARHASARVPPHPRWAARSIGATSGYFQEPPGQPWKNLPKICSHFLDLCQKHPKKPPTGFPVDFPLPWTDGLWNLPWWVIERLLWENCDDVWNLKLLKMKNTWNGVIPVPDPPKSASCGFPMVFFCVPRSCRWLPNVATSTPRNGEDQRPCQPRIPCHLRGNPAVRCYSLMDWWRLTVEIPPIKKKW